MTSQELAHRFFHNPDERGEYKGVNTHFGVSYWDNTIRSYYSYSTRIAAIATNRAGDNVLLISQSKYSRTTCKHLNELERACPYDSERIIFVPDCEMRNDYFGFKWKMKQISKITLKDLNKKANRTTFVTALEMYDNFVAHFGDKKMPKECKLIRKRKSVKDKLEYIRTKDQLLAERVDVKNELLQARIIEREKEMRAAIGKISKNRLDQIKIAFERQSDNYLRDISNKYRKILNNMRDDRGRHLSFVWMDINGVLRTSQGVTMRLECVERLLKMWQSHQKIVGENAGGYTIVENTSDYVKVGCHVIPTWNIVELCKQLAV